MPTNTEHRPIPNPSRGGIQAADSLPDNPELIAVITAAIAAFREEETPVIAALREVESPAETEDFYEEDTQAPASSFVARTIKRRG